MQRLAETALEAYRLGSVRPHFFYHAGNTLFRVYDRDAQAAQVNTDLFEPGQYLLRIYQPGWQAPEAIDLELAWLEALRQEADLPVPEPIRRLDGSLLTQVTIPGIPQTRYCALLRWIKGRRLPGDAKPSHFRAQGQLMARLHNFTQQWQLPPKPIKRHYNWNGLFMNDPEIGLLPGKSWEYLPTDWVKPFEFVSQRFRELMDVWGTGGEVYGLIHADMGWKANLLFWHGQPRPIDFDGSGFGYWMYDLAVALTDSIGAPNYAQCRAALFEGYAEYRSLPAAHLDQLDLFLAAFFVYYDLWVVGGTRDHPDYLTEEMEEQMYRGAAYVLNYVKSLENW